MFQKFALGRSHILFHHSLAHKIDAFDDHLVLIVAGTSRLAGGVA